MNERRTTADDREPTTDAEGKTGPTRAAVGTPPPGPRGLPVINSTLGFARDPLEFLSSIREYGDVAHYEAFGREFVVVSDPGLVETVLVARDDEFWRGEFEHEFSEVLDVEGLFFAEGERWRNQRLLLQNAFTPARIQSYADDMVDETVRLVEDWSDGEVVDVREAMSTLTLRALTRSLFDLEYKEPRFSEPNRGSHPRSFGGDRADCVQRWVQAMGAYSDSEFFGIRAVLPTWLPSRAEREYRRATADVEALVEEMVAERRRSDAAGGDLLSLLATGEYPNGSRPTAEEITGQLQLFLLAGHETTATVLTYACWLLAAADVEDVRSRLEQEVTTVCGDRDPTFADLPDLAITEAVGREAMRLYPPLPFLQREPHEATTLAGYRIGPATTVQLNMYGIHRDERWWSEPDAFRPDRWLSNDEDGRSVVADRDDRPEYAYFPFGGGSRHCIGMRFAMAELQLSLATMVRRVDLERVTESIDPTPRVSLDPGPVEMRVRRR
ncbi:cytochrome P450 [Natronorubrum bangense]|uniref:Cytochrome P450 n=2 Tax=Natronorubrum bangense TaxID=61858 RepID=L9WP21_9EURY|nr:cytochrome P450 [Natronorubrum bangense]ELY50078.1 cytochrome P450 [Natronorubrum bangense JCM 10635]QCC54187.1 cytochrome P450 [Natronorubrum bangense]